MVTEELVMTEEDYDRHKRHQETKHQLSSALDERDGLAVLARGLREALKWAMIHVHYPHYVGPDLSGVSEKKMADKYQQGYEFAKAALTLTPLAAAALTKAEARKEDEYWAEGDRWRQQVTEYIEIGGCPFWSNDEEPHKERCDFTALDARVRRAEQERCCQATCHYCLEHAQGKQVSAAYLSSRDEWAHKIYISGINEPLIRYCRAQAIREATDDDQLLSMLVLREALIALNQAIIEAEYAYVDGNTADEPIPRDMLKPMFQVFHNILQEPLKKISEEFLCPPS